MGVRRKEADYVANNEAGLVLLAFLTTACNNAKSSVAFRLPEVDVGRRKAVFL